MNYSEYFRELSTVSACLEKRDELSNIGRIREIKDLISIADSESKKTLGAELNELKKDLQLACDEQIKLIQSKVEVDDFVDFDPTFYSDKYKTGQGSLHPITLVMNEIVEIFQRIGFDVADGPLVETQWYNFTSLNQPRYHPARAMQDTFYLNLKDDRNENYVMRTQTSGMQIRYGETHEPPIRVVVPGQVYRNENIDATHDIMFHQIECLVVDKRISISHLKTVLQNLFAQIFEDKSLEIRFRPSYFPYTIPSMEYDISCPFCYGKGCRVCKQTGWIEIGGSGLVHPSVIKNMNLDPNEWQGFAFGFGVDRVAQFKLGISGIGQFFNGNLGFLRGE